MELELSQAEVEMLRHEPAYSITDAELIRRISLYAIQIKDKVLGNLLISKIKPEFEVAGLYPHIHKPYNISPDIIELDDSKKTLYKEIVLSQVESIISKISRYESQAKELIQHCTLISNEEKLVLISPYLKGIASIEDSYEIINYLLGDFYGNIAFEGFKTLEETDITITEYSDEVQLCIISIDKVLDLFKTDEEGEIRIFKVEKAELTISREKLAKIVFDFALEHNVNSLTFDIDVWN